MIEYDEKGRKYEERVAWTFLAMAEVPRRHHRQAGVHGVPDAEPGRAQGEAVTRGEEIEAAARALIDEYDQARREAYRLATMMGVISGTEAKVRAEYDPPAMSRLRFLLRPPPEVERGKCGECGECGGTGVLTSGITYGLERPCTKCGTGREGTNG